MEEAHHNKTTGLKIEYEEVNKLLRRIQV